ncbi:MAG: hypothetical protein GVY26_09215 [Bacteroidetes bacterium]|jgi:hypothetical protein|nr:hypothetical protein [Bacteroidota bacterium]
MKSLFNVLIFSSLCLLFQCTNVNEDEALVPAIPYEESCNSMNDIGYQEIEEGSMHNQLVLLMVENWSICSDDAVDIADEMKRILNGYSKNVVEANNMDFEEFKSVVNGLDLSSFISEL